MYPIVPPPHADMPSPIATDTTKALENRPNLLNVMRFLNPRQQPVLIAVYCEQICRDMNPLVIVEAAERLCHFPPTQYIDAI
jgi:hypothetical protein